MCLTSLLSEGVADFLGELSEKALEVQCVAVVGLVDFLDGPVHELVFAFKSESLCCHEDISHLGPSLSGIGVQGEHGVKVGDEVLFEDGVFSTDGFCHDVLEVLFGQLLFRHFKSFYLMN